MNSIKDISQYIQKTVTERLASGQVVNMSWMITEIIGEFSDISGADVDFYRICARHYVTDQVKRFIDKFNPSVDGSGQMTMDGFKYLQSAYPVKRNGERVLVPTHLLTDDEIDGRMQELEDMAAGCLVHRRELEDYKNMRKIAA